MGLAAGIALHEKAIWLSSRGHLGSGVERPRFLDRPTANAIPGRKRGAGATAGRRMSPYVAAARVIERAQVARVEATSEPTIVVVVMVGRENSNWLHKRAKVSIADETTRGEVCATPPVSIHVDQSDVRRNAHFSFAKI